MADRDQQAFWTPNGFYLPQWVADELRPAYRAPDGLYEPALSMLATPIYILPPPAPQKPARWWVRAWRRLTRWRSR